MKILKNKKGFTLTEVMIGIMILTVAIVSASQLLVGLISSNQNNLTTLQAYYLAQEGLEAVRNVRDTNWLHNRNWLDGEIWGGNLEIGNSYEFVLLPGAFNTAIASLNGGSVNNNLNISDLNPVKPWEIKVAGANLTAINKKEFGGSENFYLSSNIQAGVGVDGIKPDTFKRVITLKKYDCEEKLKAADFACLADDKANYVLVESKIIWEIGAKSRDLTLYEVLTDWKGGAL
ncbi:MAG: type II secretion system protein [Patescibacteria group bacterium]|mgnify:CR=1 FL=1